MTDTASLGAAEVVVDDGFGLDNLPFGVGRIDGGPSTILTRVGDRVVPVADVVGDLVPPGVWASTTLNPFLSLGPEAWATVRSALRNRLADLAALDTLRPADDAVMSLPVEIGDYVDFYSSIHHAENMGRILRPGTDPLMPNWRHLPVGYHGRAGTVVVSGTPVRRPAGLVPTEDGVHHRPSRQLDIELEVGFVIGVGNEPGDPVPVDAADSHVFGVVLVNDWSARDIQAFEYRPLGPFLGKSFMTSMSAWVVPLEALRPALVDPPLQEPPPHRGLRANRPWGVDLELEAALDGTTIAHTSFVGTYWTFAQQLAHLTSNGATIRTGDLIASGTVSGPGRGERGSLIEATWNGAEPIRLDDGSERCWLADGDEVRLSGRARFDRGGREVTITLGEVSGAVLPTGG